MSNGTTTESTTLARFANAPLAFSETPTAETAVEVNVAEPVKAQKSVDFIPKLTEEPAVDDKVMARRTRRRAQYAARMAANLETKKTKDESMKKKEVITAPKPVATKKTAKTKDAKKVTKRETKKQVVKPAGKRGKKAAAMAAASPYAKTIASLERDAERHTAAAVKTLQAIQTLQELA